MMLYPWCGRLCHLQLAVLSEPAHLGALMLRLGCGAQDHAPHGAPGFLVQQVVAPV